MPQEFENEHTFLTPDQTSENSAGFQTLIICSSNQRRPIGNDGLFHSLFHMILALFGLAPPHAVTNGPPLVKRGYGMHGVSGGIFGVSAAQ